MAPDRVDGRAPGWDLPSVAVVMPCFNAEPWIGLAIRSVLDQRYPGLEVVVVDDGSTDGSLEVIKSFGEQIRWVSGPNRGACAARNTGLDLISADWVLFFDADDYLEGDLLRAMAPRAEALDLDLAVGMARFVQPDGSSELYAYPRGSGADTLLRGWLDYKYVQTGALLWRKDFLTRIGGWDEDVLRSQDIELVVRALLLGARARSFEIGYSVWVNHDVETRITRQTSHASLASEIAFHTRLTTQIADGPADLRLLFAKRFYRLATQAYSFGYPDLARTAISMCRRLGLKGHFGPLRRRVAATVLGLETCARIRQAMLRRRSRLARA